MLQTLPIQMPHGCELADVPARGAAGAAGSGAFSRALQQATQEERKPAAERAGDTAELRTRHHASTRSEESHPDRATDPRGESRATDTRANTGAAALAAHEPPDLDTGAATPPESESESGCITVPQSMLPTASANDVPMPNPTLPVDRARPSVGVDPVAAGVLDEVSDQVCADLSVSTLSLARAATGDATRARPITHAADVNAGVSPIAEPVTPQRRLEDRSTDLVREPMVAMNDARGNGASAETAGANGVATTAALGLAAGTPAPPVALATHLGNDALPAAAPSAATLASPVHSREFAPAFGSQVALWVRDGVQEARLQLHPAELGPIAVQIALDGMSAHIDFHAQHALTRAAIEASLPALGSALSESGLTLAGGSVFGQSAGESGARMPNPPPRPGRAISLARGNVIGPIGATTARSWRRGLLDVFA